MFGKISRCTPRDQLNTLADFASLIIWLVWARADAVVLGGTKLMFIAPLAQKPDNVGHHAGAGPNVPKQTERSATE